MDSCVQHSENWKKMEQVFESELRDALRLLKLNREKVPEEILQTRYRKKYARLKADIRNLAEEYVKLHITCGLLFKEEDREVVTDTVNQVIAGCGIGRALGKAAFQRQDMDEIRMLQRTQKNRCGDKPGSGGFRKQGVRKENGQRKEIWDGGKMTGKNLQQRLLAVREQIPALSKKNYNEEVNYDFTKIDDIINT